MIFLKYIKKIFWSPRKQKIPFFIWFINAFLIFCLFFIFASFVYSRSSGVWDWSRIRVWLPYLSKAYVLTLIFSFLSLLLSLVMGFFLALWRVSPLIFLRQFVLIYTEIIKGTPLIVFILIVYYLVANAFGLSDRFVAGVVILSLFSSATMGEIIRAGLESIPHTQKEAAKSLGLTKKQTIFYVIFPQMITRSLPALSVQVANLIKNSSLLSVISLVEFYQASANAAAQTYAVLEFYLFMAAGYLAITLPLSYITEQIQKRFEYDS